MEPRVKRPLEGKFRDLLVEGNQGQYYSRSEAVMAVTMAMYRAGWDETEYRTAFNDTEEHKLADYFFHRKKGQSRTPHWRTRQLDSIWKKVTESYSTDFPDAVSVRQEVGLIRSHLSDTPLTGRTRITDTLVLEYIHRIATERGVINPNCATRDIAKACNMGHMTASRALNRLVEAGWLKREESQGMGKADTYRVSYPVKTGSHKDTLYLHHECEDSVSIRDRETETHETDLVTITTRGEIRTLSCIGDYPLTPKEIISLSGSSKATVFRHLKSLVQMGLLENTDGNYSRTSKTYEETAEEYQATGTRQQRLDKIDRDREAFHNSPAIEGMQFNYDKKRYGVQVAKENAQLRTRNRMEAQLEEEGLLGKIDPVTGEILEEEVTTVRVPAKVLPMKTPAKTYAETMKELEDLKIQNRRKQQKLQEAARAARRATVKEENARLLGQSQKAVQSPVKANGLASVREYLARQKEAANV